MPSIESPSAVVSPADAANAGRLPVNRIGAHLRLLPGLAEDFRPKDFRIVVTFHLADGTLGEAELKPHEAAGLMSELAKAIDRGNHAAPGITPREARENRHA